MRMTKSINEPQLTKPIMDYLAWFPTQVSKKVLGGSRYARDPRHHRMLGRDIR